MKCEACGGPIFNAGDASENAGNRHVVAYGPSTGEVHHYCADCWRYGPFDLRGVQQQRQAVKATVRGIEGQ